jgi:hypothetical protein
MTLTDGLTIVLIVQTFFLIYIELRQPKVTSHIASTVIVLAIIIINIIGSVISIILLKPNIWVILLLTSSSGIEVFLFITRFIHLNQINLSEEEISDIVNEVMRLVIKKDGLSINIKELSYLLEAFDDSNTELATDIYDYGLLSALTSMQEEFKRRFPNSDNRDLFLALFGVKLDSSFFVLKHTLNLEHKSVLSAGEKLKWGTTIQGITGMCATTKDMVYIPDLENKKYRESERWVPSNLLGDVIEKKGFFIAVPVVTSNTNECIAVIDIFSPTKITEESLTPDDVMETIRPYDGIIEMMINFGKKLQLI